MRRDLEIKRKQNCRERESPKGINQVEHEKASEVRARVTSAEAAREDKPTPSPFIRHFTSFVPK